MVAHWAAMFFSEAPSPAGEHSGNGQLPTQKVSEPSEAELRQMTEFFADMLKADRTFPFELSLRADALCQAGEFVAAEGCAREALRIAAEQKHTAWRMCHLYRRLAQTLHCQGNYDEEERVLGLAYESADGVPLDLMCALSTARRMVGTLEAQGRRREAEKWKDRCKTLLDNMLEARG